MKIVFAWTEKFRTFKNTGINFSSTEKFSFDPLSMIISKKDLPAFPKNFFGKDILDVTGIVGKNGVGKSNALELVCRLLKGPKLVETDYLLIVKEGRRFSCYYSFSDNRIPGAPNLTTIDFHPVVQKINPLKVVYFSNVFDERVHEFDKDIADISNNSLYRFRGMASYPQHLQFGNQIRFINSSIFADLQIETPSEIRIDFKRNRRDDWRVRRTLEDIYSFARDVDKKIRSLPASVRFANLLSLECLFRVLSVYNRVALFTNSREPIPFDDLITSVKNSANEDISDLIVNYLAEKFGDWAHRPVEDNIAQDGVKLLALITFIRKVKASRIPIEERKVSPGKWTFLVPYKRSTRAFIRAFIENCEELDLNISWTGISSGHKAYLNLFSSLYRELKSVKMPFLLLCIDEGDLYLHPQWQIEFFSKLMKVLPQLYSGKIQLLLTSHSPFLLSDLPNRNITSLGIDSDGIVQSIDGIDLTIKTFGGNLYDLYAEPLFLGSAKRGHFAQQKIDQLIDVVKGTETVSKTKRIEVMKTLEVLGDELISFSLKRVIGHD
ncbi:AAA family ATPase [Collimonas humicola]|uniref:AAA family ATPase n=1 Tax=Collimonas humicola TaxID=2825886 RepID=UPI001B8AA40A|nr:AAA family ATPase [Collimonas humicola]